jgi:hypothetical protein
VRPGSTIPHKWFPARKARTRGFDGSLVKPTKLLKRQRRKDLEGDSLPANFRRMERREWWLWSMAFAVTLLVTLGLSFFVFRLINENAADMIAIVDFRFSW